MVAFPFWPWAFVLFLAWLEPVKKIGVAALRGLWWVSKWFVLLLLSCEGCYWLDQFTR